MDNRDSLREFGRLRYVEPTNFFKNREGTYSDSINFPYEDYNIAVDLTIRQANRYSCGWWTQDGTMNEVTYSSGNGTLSFLGGSGGYDNETFMTTNFTDISMTSPETNTPECLGIESISIQYNSWLYPQVVIKFVDVRGATVMQPAEKGYYKPEMEANTSKIYKSLFSFPYPMFMLKVKGFYGKGVTYRLAVNKTQFEFDANTGNFNITVDFIGYMYGIYSDIPMTFIAAAPFMKNGKEYWNSKVASGEFSFRDGDGNAGPPMITIPELKLRLAQAAVSEESTSAAAEGARLADNYDARREVITSLKDTFPFNDWYQPDNVPMSYGIFANDADCHTFMHALSGYVETVSAYDYTYGTEYLKDMTSLTEIITTLERPVKIFRKASEAGFGNDIGLMLEFMSRIHYIDRSGTNFRGEYVDAVMPEIYDIWKFQETVNDYVAGNILFGKNPVETYNDYIKKFPNVREYIENERKKRGLHDFYVIILPRGGDCFDPKYFFEKVSAEVIRIAEEKEAETRYYKNKENGIIEKVLGFRPSIRNIYELMFAHMETFVHCFYDSTKLIKDQLEKNQELRSKSHYSITDGDTDTESEKIKTSTGVRNNTSARCKLLPPYTAFYKETFEGTGTSPKKVLRWAEELPNGHELEEVNFVKDLLSATETYFEKLQDVEAQIELLSSSASTIDATFTKGAPSTSVAEFIPLTTFDFVNKDRTGNPYAFVGSKLYDGGNTVMAEIMGIFMLRAYYYIATHKGHWLIENINQDLEGYTFGRIEGVNLFKAVRDKFTNGFIKFLKRFASGFDELFNGFLVQAATDGEGYLNRQFYEAWQTDAPNLRKSLFETFQGGYEWSLEWFGTYIEYNPSFMLFNYHKGIRFEKDECDENGYVKTTLNSDGTPNENTIRVHPERTYIMFPMFVESMEKMKEYYSQGIDVLRNPNMIPIQVDGRLYGTPNSKVKTFYLYDGVRDYLKNLSLSIDAEIKNTSKDIAECLDYGDRDNSDFGGTLSTESGERCLWRYQDNLNQTFVDTTYSDFVITTSNGAEKHGDEIDALIGDGGYKEIESLYIKYPSIDASYGYNTTRSIFDNPLYLKQKNILARAWMFIQSIPIYGKDNPIADKNENGISLKAKLLREGAYYWYMANHDKGVVDFSPIKVNVKPFGEIVHAYKQPGPRETLMARYKSDITEFFIGEKEDAVLRFLAKNDKNEMYQEWELPEGTTPSRIIRLKKYFEDWATSTDETSGFALNEKRLLNKSLYSRDLRPEKVSEFAKTQTVSSWFGLVSYDMIIGYDSTSVIESKIKMGAPEDEYYLGEDSRNYTNGLDIVFMAGNVENKETPAAHESRKLQYFLRDLFFGVATVFDYYNGLCGTEEQGVYNIMTCNSSALQMALQGFMKSLNDIYGLTVEDLEVDAAEFYKKMYSAQANCPFNDTDLKLSTYSTIKSLYDKWLCSPYHGPEDTWALTRRNESVSDFDSFKYADSFYNDIGDTLMVNITKVSNWLNSCMPTASMNTTEGVMGYTGRTLYEFLAEVAEDCGGTLMALPQKFGLAKADDVKDMFTPISIKDDWAEDSSTFIFLYTYKPSEHLGDTDTKDVDMNGWSADGDGLDLTDDEIVGKVMSDSTNGFVVPAFGVTYGKQNQTIFKNVQLSTASQGVTEASIAATMNIASKSSESPRESTLYGQDLYRVLSNYSYQCNVETMGNTQILPMMYFQLNNIPFWRGAYMIKKVSHNITAGNMTTTFEGIRQNRYAIPMSDGSVVIQKQTGDEKSDTESESTPIGGDNNPTTGEGGTVEKAANDTTANPQKTINDTIDFDDAGITPQTPLICITPSHGPKTQKAPEWKWSSKMADRIVEILKTYTYKNGTPYIVQRCNKDGNHTTNAGYRMTETKNLIEKYGSDCVVSLVAHWNGGAGNYYLALKNGRDNYTRPDSIKLSECLVEEAKIVQSKRAEYTTLPDGAMDGKIKLELFPAVPQWKKDANGKILKDENNRSIPLLGPDGKQVHDYHSTDGAVQCNCACALTENWFADYPKNSKWNSAGYDSLVNNKYKTMRGWMENDGLEILAQMNAKGIKRYIDTLS
jgi:hypothetical protein